MTTLVQITRCGSFQKQDWCGFHGILYLETCFGDVPLPLGEGGAKRRVRAGNAPSSGPSGHLLPEGEGHEPPFRLIWTPGNSPRQDPSEVPIRNDQCSIPNSQFSSEWRSAWVEHLAIRHPLRMRIEHWELSIGQIPGPIHDKPCGTRWLPHLTLPRSAEVPT